MNVSSYGTRKNIQVKGRQGQSSFISEISTYIVVYTIYRKHIISLLISKTVVHNYLIMLLDTEHNNNG